MASQSNSGGPSRKRGRPAGKNRVPLSIEERRARNAQYERERRIENADAMVALAEAAGCDARLSHADIIATVMTYIRSAGDFDGADSIESLRRYNDKLIMQIQTLEQRLAVDTDGAITASSSQDSEEDGHVRTHSNGRGRKKIKIQHYESDDVSRQSPVESLLTTDSSPEYILPQLEYASTHSGTESEDTVGAPVAWSDTLIADDNAGNLDYLGNRSIEDFIVEYL